jgi:hypothetical protein
MAVFIKIDFDSVYEFEETTPDLKLTGFNTKLASGQDMPLKVKISKDPHLLLPNVYNMAFGPLNKQGKIDDRAELVHASYSKVFSTILFSAFVYLQNNTRQYLGVDGSDNARAYYYYRAIKRNFDYLDNYFVMYGIKYYVRITRLGRTQYDNPFDFQDVIPYPYRIRKEDSISQDLMYNYFMFGLKNPVKEDL